MSGFDDDWMEFHNEEDQVYVADRIVKQRVRRGMVEYFIKWRGFSSAYNTWEPKENVLDLRLIELFEESEMTDGTDASDDDRMELPNAGDLVYLAERIVKRRVKEGAVRCGTDNKMFMHPGILPRIM
ncbi:chromobox protein homolog 1 isoform X1 [Folsomia candida]|uniref:chromobox protein homolog 1 isoform X1 n=2 Tax=Folsomia candida TaxID=158441 RepID=UPI001604B83B|nr:chromobox protein homolog 1 isoform X1 [Folsomia candida]